MTSPPFKLAQIDHIVLRVNDMNRALDFYCGVLGCTEERRVPQFGLVQLRAGASLIDLIDVPQQPRSGDGRNMDHFALTISPFEETAIRAYLAGKGVKTGKVAQRYGAMGVGPSIYIHDPDGNQVELKGPPLPG